MSKFRCFLFLFYTFWMMNALAPDTAHAQITANQRNAYIQQILNSAGFGLLNANEQAAARELFGRNVYLGRAAAATFSAMPADFVDLSAAGQAAIIRKVNRNRLTWVRGYGFGSDTFRDETITNSMDDAVLLYNALGVFDKHLTANNDPGVPTADANFDGWMRFGSQLSLRTALHETAHTLGSGTHWRWPGLMYDGVWHGQYANMQLGEFDGTGAALHGDTQHTWPYGLNQDAEYSGENARRHVLIMGAIRRDMLTADQVNYAYATNVPNGTYTLIPRNAPNSALDVLNSNTANGTAIGINKLSSATSQKFLVDLQADGTYRIRTALTGNRAVELPGGNTTNGSPVQLWDDNGLAPQRWFLIPTDNGFYKISPLNNNFKGMDVANAGTADGTLVQSWDYLDNFAQQWLLVPSTQTAYTTALPNGTYNISPRHAPDKLLEVYGFNGANGDKIDIWAANGGDNQKFLFDVQADGTYRIRTALAGNRAVELPSGVTTNGTKLQLFDDNGADAQRWFLIPTDNGWFKIAPKNNISKALDVEAISTADGALVQSWEYLTGLNQQWKLTAIGATGEDTTAPNVAVVTPGNASIAKRVDEISGTASDNAGGSGLSKVVVYVRRFKAGTTTYEYWAKRSGIWGWGDTNTGFDTTLGTNGTWSVNSSSPAGTQLPEGANFLTGSYQFYARAYDQKENVATSINNKVTVDTSAPTSCVVSSPAHNSTIKGVPSIRGTAADGTGGSGIARVVAYLRRFKAGSTTTYEYWAKRGTVWGWGDSNAGFDTVFSGGSWLVYANSPVGTVLPSVEQLATGSYQFYAIAWDKAATYKISSINKVTVDNVLPANCVVTSPGKNAGINSLTVIKGTASDTTGGSGIAHVDVFLRRGPSSAYEYWAKRSSVWSWGSSATAIETVYSAGAWRVDNTAPAGTQLPAGSTNLPPGPYQVFAKAYDKAENALLSAINSFSVVNSGNQTEAGTEPSSVVLSNASAEAASGTVKLVFSAAVDTVTAENASRYSVSLNGVKASITNVVLPSDTTVVLTLQEEIINSSDTALVSYDLRDSKGLALQGQAKIVAK